MVFAFMALYGISLFVSVSHKGKHPDGSAASATSAASNPEPTGPGLDVGPGSTSRVASARTFAWVMAETNYAAAIKYVRNSQMDEAVAGFQAALEHNPLHVKARAALGAIQYGTRDYAAAESNLMQALAADPMVIAEPIVFQNEKHVDRLLALMYEKQGRFADQLAIIEWMLSREPGSTELHKVAAELCMKKLNLPAAAVPHLKFIAQQSKSSEAMDNLADAYLQLGKYDEAISELQRSLELNESDLDAYFSMVTCLIRSGKPAEAIEALEKAATKCKPDKVVSWAKGERELEGIRTNEAYRAWLKKYDNDTRAAGGA